MKSADLLIEVEASGPQENLGLFTKSSYPQITRITQIFWNRGSADIAVRVQNLFRDTPIKCVLLTLCSTALPGRRYADAPIQCVVVVAASLLYVIYGSSFRFWD
jgi:hypothetical protein